MRSHELESDARFCCKSPPPPPLPPVNVAFVSEAQAVYAGILFLQNLFDVLHSSVLFNGPCHLISVVWITIEKSLLFSVFGAGDCLLHHHRSHRLASRKPKGKSAIDETVF